ncbi:hypothetical protein FRC18_004554 [Serendipita sp. 400]|nr:hypothetical protein FRC18_004554 [Serendipita sp. 400]
MLFCRTTTRIKLIIILFLALDGPVVVVRGDGPSCTWVDSNRYKILVKDDVSSGGERKESVKSAFAFLNAQMWKEFHLQETVRESAPQLSDRGKGTVPSRIGLTKDTIRAIQSVALPASLISGLRKHASVQCFVEEDLTLFGCSVSRPISTNLVLTM